MRGKDGDGRYYLVLRQYKRPSGRFVASCKQLSHAQMTDLLALCESYGWQCPGKAADHFTKLAAREGHVASTAQQESILLLSGDLGWTDERLDRFILRMTNRQVRLVARLSVKQASKVIDGLRSILSRTDKTNYGSVKDVAQEYATDGKKENQIG